MDPQAEFVRFDVIEALIIKAAVLIGLVLFCLLHIKYHLIHLFGKGKNKRRRNRKRKPPRTKPEDIR